MKCVNFIIYMYLRLLWFSVSKIYTKIKKVYKDRESDDGQKSHFNKRMKTFILQINEMKSTLKYPRLPHYLIMLHLINALDPLTTIVFYKGITSY